MGYYFSPFRKEYHELVHKVGITKCPFCSPANIKEQSIYSKDGYLIENKHFRWMINYYPYCNAHTLVVSKRHLTSIYDQTLEEVLAHHDLIHFAADTIQKLYPKAGIEIFVQYGKGSRMSLPHIHTHVVPSLPDDPFRGLEKLGIFEALEREKERVVLLPVEVTLGRSDLIKALANVIDSSWLAKYPTIG